MIDYAGEDVERGEHSSIVILLEIGSRQECQATLGAWGGVRGVLEGERVREKGVGDEWGKIGGLGWGRENG